MLRGVPLKYLQLKQNLFSTPGQFNTLTFHRRPPNSKPRLTDTKLAAKSGIKFPLMMIESEQS